MNLFAKNWSKISKNEVLNLIEWIAIYIVSLYMIGYGAGKALQFGELSDYTLPINRMKPMDIMWAFYSYSKPFAIAIGIFEIIGALLLVIPKTRILGGLFLTFILMNIILQDIAFDVHKGALANAIMYQVLILGIFYRHRAKIKTAFLVLKCQFNYRLRWIYLPVAMIIALGYELLIYLINQFINLF